MSRRVTTVATAMLLLAGCQPAAEPATADAFNAARDDYTQRAQLNNVLAAVGPTRIAITDHLRAAGQPPASLRELGIDRALPHGAAMEFANGLLLIRFDGASAPAALRGDVLALGLQQDGFWSCGRAAPQSPWVGADPAHATPAAAALLPSNCR